MNIEDNIKKYQDVIGDRNCRIVAISKRKPVPLIMEAYRAGQRIFGENKVQEMMEKQPQLPGDIQWHMVGHLQRNKVKYIASYVDLIHSVDSYKLLKEINKQAKKCNRTIHCLLQVHIAREETKFGLSEPELFELLDTVSASDMGHVKITGLMGMATYTEDEKLIRSEFSFLRRLLESCSERYDRPVIDLRELSMGMSGDFRIAIEEGSTMIRIGTGIFGARD